MPADPAVRSRLLMGLAAYKHGIDAYEYYALGNWEQFFQVTSDGRAEYVPLARPETLTPFLEVTDMMYDATSYDGEALLLLPGPTGILSTLHFDSIRDGLEDLEYFRLLSGLVAAARAKGIEVSAEAAKLSIPDAVFDSVHNGDCGSRPGTVAPLVAPHPDALKNQYPEKILWSKDPAVQRRNRVSRALRSGCVLPRAQR